MKSEEVKAPAGNMPLVSVCCVTYNHEKFIAQALDGFLSQQAPFPFEVIVADDCSTDRTESICREYSRKHPQIIKYFRREKNLGVGENFRLALYDCRGSYLSLCDGDDYWTDPLKLKLQVEFLAADPGYALCFHPVKTTYEDRSKPDELSKEDNSIKGRILSAGDLIRGNFIHCNSVMYRFDKKDEIIASMRADVMPPDWFFHLLVAKYGNIGYIDRIMSVYRKHSGGAWTSSENEEQRVKKYSIPMLQLLKSINEYYGYKHEKELAARASGILGGMFPSAGTRLRDLDLEVKSIKMSRLWKFRNFLVRTLGVFGLKRDGK